MARRDDAVSLHFLDEILPKNDYLLRVELEPRGVRREVHVLHALAQVPRKVGGQGRPRECLAQSGVLGPGNEHKLAPATDVRRRANKVSQEAEAVGGLGCVYVRRGRYLIWMDSRPPAARTLFVTKEPTDRTLR